MQYVVIDLEMCNVAKLYRKSYPYKSEIIQIGAVLLDENFEITDKFNEYVKPKYGDLDHFIKKLTGISKLDLSRADEFPVVFERFSKRVDSEEVSYITSSLSILNKTGGNIINVFSSIESMLFSKRKLQQEMKSLTSSANMVSKILLLMPIVFVLLISIYYTFYLFYFYPQV